MVQNNDLLATEQTTKGFKKLYWIAIAFLLIQIIFYYALTLYLA